MTVIAEDIDVFEVRFFDGEEWSNEWSEEMVVMPQLVEVNIVGKQPTRGSPAMESITANLVSSVGAIAEALDSGGEAQSSTD